MFMGKPKFSILDHRVAGWYYPWMMKGLVPSSSPLMDKVRLMKRLGFDGVGTSWWDLVSCYQERGDLSQVKRLSTELNFPLTAYGFVADGWAFGKGKAQQNAILLGQYSLNLARAAGCMNCYLLGPFDSGNVRDAAKSFRELCQYAAQFGMTLALEFVGIAPLINSLNTALEVLELADAKNGGVAIDSYHFFAGASTVKDLEVFPLSKIHLVHLADGPADLSDPATELDRQMPGEGQLPLVDFVQVLLDRGFDGFWHVECIQGRDYASELALVAERGLQLTKAIVAEAESHGSTTL
jgi:4-hydroxyphenylpyruvate dioxygenase